MKLNSSTSLMLSLSRNSLLNLGLLEELEEEDADDDDS